MRRALSLVLAAGIVACASASPPPGGPEDKAPPRVVRLTPDTNSVNVHPKDVSFYFDEVINDRGSGEQEVDRYFLVSPSGGAPHVSWHRTRIDVRPRDGFKNGITYTVTMVPGLTDLRSNRMKEGVSLVFSTGASLAQYRITGTVFDWAAERVAPQAFVEAFIPGPDSIRYMAKTDSLGSFTVGPMPQGTYLVRALIDQNGNRALDRNEAFDTVRVTAPSSGTLQLLAAIRDTLPARILTVAAADSATLTVTFDRSLDPTVPVTAAQFRLVGPDSAVLPIRAALSPRQVQAADSITRRALEDSVRRADSLAGKPLTPPPTAAPVSAVPGAKPPPPPPPKPSVPPPYTIVVLKLERPLAPNTQYRLSVTDVHALSRRVTSSERSFTTPKPPPPPPPKTPADSAAARRPATTTPPASRPPRS